MEQFSIVKWIIDILGLPSSWSIKYQHIVMAVVVFILITISALLSWRKLKKTERRLVPEDRATSANVYEVIVEGLLRMMEDTIGPQARKHLPLIGAIFIYLLYSNLMGVIPGLVPPTDNINTNAACAVVVFLYYNIVGIREQGIKNYLKHMSGPIIWLAPLMFAIELVSHFVRPISLSVRLFGNILGDHMVLGMFSQLVPFLVPIIFQALAIFVAFIQAFVFTLLSIVYISMASAKEEH